MRKNVFFVVRFSKVMTNVAFAFVGLFFLEGCCNLSGCGNESAYCPLKNASEYLAIDHKHDNKKGEVPVPQTNSSAGAEVGNQELGVKNPFAVSVNSFSEAVVKQPVVEFKPSYMQEPIREATVMTETSLLSTTHATSKNQSFVINEAMLPVRGEKDEKTGPLGIRSISTNIIAGPNLSFKSSNESNASYGGANHQHKPGVGFQLGVGSTLTFNDKWSVAPAMMVKQNNASETIKSSGGGEGGNYSYESTTDYSYTYLSAPVLARYQASDRLSIYAGPELNYLLGANTKSGGTYNNGGKQDITSSSVRLGLGVQAGVKYEIPSSDGGSIWGIELLYDHRISRLNKKQSENTYGGNYDIPAWHMKSLQLGITCDICNLLRK
jgi:opacity protein-like surface antigen